EAWNRPRHGREARQVVRPLGQDDRLAARDRARPQDAGDRGGDQADEVRHRPGAEGQGAAAVPAARGEGREGVAGAVRPRQDAGPRRRGRDRPGRARARADRVRGGAARRRGEGRVKTVAYYKGCLASLSAKELDSSTQALAPKVGLDLI